MISLFFHLYLEATTYVNNINLVSPYSMVNFLNYNKIKIKIQLTPNVHHVTYIQLYY